MLNVPTQITTLNDFENLHYYKNFKFQLKQSSYSCIVLLLYFIDIDMCGLYLVQNHIKFFYVTLKQTGRCQLFFKGQSLGYFYHIQCI